MLVQISATYGTTKPQWVNFMGVYCYITVMQLPLSNFNDKSKLVEAMAGCRQTTSHCLCQCRRYGANRLRYVKSSPCLPKLARKLVLESRIWNRVCLALVIARTEKKRNSYPPLRIKTTFYSSCIWWHRSVCCYINHRDCFHMIIYCHSDSIHIHYANGLIIRA